MRLARHASALAAILFLTAVLVSVGVSHPAFAQYRDGQPDVVGGLDLNAERAKTGGRHSDAERIESFRTAYAQAGRPRIAVYWNRQLSDQDGDWNGNQRTVIERNLQRNGLKAGKAEQGGESETTTISDQTREQSSSRSGPAELDMMEFEDGMIAAFESGGCQLVDRNVIVRLAGASAGGKSSLGSETGALKTYADILAEVVVVADPGGSLGYAFRVTMKSVTDGRILASIVHRPNEKSMSESGEFVAGDNGFERKVDKGFAVQGRQVGAKAMSALARSL